MVIGMTSEDEKKKNLEEWMKAYGTKLLRMNFLYLNDIHMAEDVTQETFLKAYRCYDGFQGRASVKTWLTRIAINLCKDEIKSARHRKVDYSGIDLAEDQAAVYEVSVENPEYLAEHRQRDLELMAAVRMLSPKNREIILLYYYRDFSEREIGVILDIPEGTVSARIHRAKKQLKKSLKGWWEDEKTNG